MFDLFKWLIVIQLIGLFTLPIGNFIFPRIYDKGYTISKILGILFIAFISWILNVYHILPSNKYSLWFIFTLFAIIFLIFNFNNYFNIKNFLSKYWRNILISEIIFFLIFIFWIVIRGIDPSISHTEQPMDLAFLNASYNSGLGNPNDIWFAGESINYYYFGYWTIAILAKLTNIPPYVAYNLALALIPALSGIIIFGFVSNLLKYNFINNKKSLLLSFLAILFICFMSNLEVLLEFMSYNGIGSVGLYSWIGIENLKGPNSEMATSWAPQEFWWWFRSTRIINTFEFGKGLDYTIQEFPFFSFLLGDLHPHLMSIPFFILAIKICWQWFILPVNYFGFSTNNYKLQYSKSLDKFGYVYLFITSLVFGTLAFVNFWSVPTVYFILFILISLKLFKCNNSLDLKLIFRSFIPILVIFTLSVLFFLPFYIDFDSIITGVKPVLITTRYIHFLIVWGIYLLLTIPFVLHIFTQTRVLVDWLKVFILSAILWITPYLIWVVLIINLDTYNASIWGRFIHILPFGILISISFYNALWVLKNKNNLSLSFVMVIIGLSYLLILGSELLYIGDFFENRMNTIFKLYYQVWILLGLVVAYIIYYFWFTNKNKIFHVRLFNRIIFILFVIFSIISLYYAPAAINSKIDCNINSKIDCNRSNLSLNGLGYLEENEYNSIMFLISYAESEEVILEAVGEWFDMGLISRSSGLSNIVNWPGHQLQWRNMSNEIFQRENHIREIYQTQDLNKSQSLINKYKVSYIYVGPRERNKYGESGMGKFNFLFEEIFHEGDIIIYKVN